MKNLTCLDEKNSIDVQISRRFKSFSNLYGESNVNRLFFAHILVVGLGGVGSWIVEALARSAVGFLTLVDLDNISLGNTNRQIHAYEGQYGKAKTSAMQERALLINPNIHIRTIEDFITEENIEQLIFSEIKSNSQNFVPPYDIIIDAIDDTSAKASLIANCFQRQQLILTIGGAGGKFNPMCINCSDLSNVEYDPLLSAVRSRLRRLYGFPPGTLKGKKRFFKVPAIYSKERIIKSVGSGGQERKHHGLNCAGLGSSVCVTATMGFTAAAYALDLITGRK